MASSATSNTSQITQITADVERALNLYSEKCNGMLLNQFSVRSNLEYIDRQYIREADYTTENFRAKIANRIGDKSKLQDVTVPIVMPQVNAALGYLVNVFCTGYPVFGVAANTEQEPAALQMETIIGENAISFGWVRQLIMFFRDGLKYNLHGVEIEWQQKTTASIQTDATAPSGTKQVTVLRKGNSLRRMDMYNTFYDPRVHPAEIHTEGEFAGYIEMYSRVRLLQKIMDQYPLVPKARIDAALATGPITGGLSGSGAPYNYYTPMINPWPIMNRGNMQTFDWTAWWQGMSANAKMKQPTFNNAYQLQTMYARIIPDDFGIKTPQSNLPQIWKFLTVNNRVILYAERQTNVHNYLPILFGQPIEDGLDFQTKSYANNVTDMQDIASAFMQGYIASKRRLVGDRVIYDPLRIRKKDIESTNPAAKIPVRPSAYGRTVAEAVYQFPYRDEQTQTLLNGVETVSKMADNINGQNPAQRGQFVKGNKTLHEYDDIMGHGNSDAQIMGIELEAQVFTPMKEIIKLNILQYQDEDTMYNRDSQQNVKINPVDLRKAAIAFNVSDGMMPTDKVMNSDELSVALQVLGSSPQLAAAYNMGPLFTYLNQLRGADLSTFEKPQWQVMFEQQMQAWQQAAAQAAKVGSAFNTPMPQLPPQLQQLAQQQQQAAGQGNNTNQQQQSGQGSAAQSTQGAI